jgi:transcriptional regulator with XRE-family HTH domain
MSVKEAPAVRSQKVGNAEFSKWLVKTREDRDLTRYELAEMVGISYPYVSQLETGYRVPSTAVIMALAKALEVQPGEILTVIHPPEMVEADATMQMLASRLARHPKLQDGKNKATILTVDIVDQRLVIALDDGTTITMDVDRRANAA